MIRSVEASMDIMGNIKLFEPVKVSSSCRVLITILDEKPFFHVNEEALLSEAILAEDWNRPEEDEAWEHF